LSQAETHEIVAELKAIIIEALQILGEKEDVRNGLIRPKAMNKAVIKARLENKPCRHGMRPTVEKDEV
jgi:hypothetical protein